MLTTAISACEEQDPAADEAATCEPGDLGCECAFGFCQAGLECVGNVCIDPNCQPGSEFCECGLGDQCFTGLECIDGLCQSTGSEGTTSDGTTSDGTTSDGTTSDGTTSDGCEPNASLECVGNAVYWFDSCGNMGQLEQSCGAMQTCNEGECVDIPPMCGNGMLDPGEQCENGMLGGASCMTLGYDDGPLACDQCFYDTSDCFYCDCMAGECCSDGCDFDDVNTACEFDNAEYGCPNGTDPGADVSVRTRDRYCSGDSASCSGNYGPWSGWSVADNCTDSEHCVPGDSTCNPCNWSYDVTQYECPTFSAAGAGNEIFKTCATTDAQGYMTVKARKGDNSTFGNRPYQVRVSDPADDPCGPNTYYFVISDSDPVGIGTNELTFSFPAQWLAGQTQKAYCVTASTQVGDVGYNANNAQQQSWWYSKKAIVERTCN